MHKNTLKDFAHGGVLTFEQEVRDKAKEQILWICKGVVDAEDFWFAGRTEPRMSTGIIKHVVFGRNEPALQHLHRGFAAELAAFRARSARGATKSAGADTKTA